MSFTFIDLFAGVGGMRLAFEAVGGRCVFSSEIDKAARATYAANFGEEPAGDIREEKYNVPDHDILVAGFPCQPFSISGVSARNALGQKSGFDCEKSGNLFFELLDIVQRKRPKIIFLENVKNFKTHDNGQTHGTVKRLLEGEGYRFYSSVICSSTRVPQRRKRCYMVAVRADLCGEYEFPSFEGHQKPLIIVLESDAGKEYTLTDGTYKFLLDHKARHSKKGTGFGFVLADLGKPAPTLVARYGKDGRECLIEQYEKNPRKLSKRECARLQGFPESFILPKAKTQAYKQMGNSVSVPVIEEIAQSIVAKYIDASLKT